MANSLKESTRVAESSISTGTGAMTLAGAIAPYETFTANYSNNQTAIVIIAMGNDWELTKITFTSGTNSISRDQVYASTNGGALINWGAGTKTISVVHPGWSDLDSAGRAALLELMMTASEVTVASASTCDILGAASPRVEISGTTTITSFGTGANKIRFVRFSGTLTLTHNGTSLILPGAANITTSAGATCIVISDGSSNARVFGYQRANGFPIAPAMPASTTDNAAIRADGTGGNLQNSAFIIDDSGNVSSFGGQIAFPASQNASSNANTLDDYEEGTFTPDMSFSTPGTSSFSVASANGTYIKIGRFVWVRIFLRVTPTVGTGSGSVQIGGLPFAPDIDTDSLVLGGLDSDWTWPTSRTSLHASTNSGQTFLNMRASGSAQGVTSFAASNMTSGNQHDVTIGGSFRTAS